MLSSNLPAPTELFNGKFFTWWPDLAQQKERFNLNYLDLSTGIRWVLLNCIGSSSSACSSFDLGTKKRLGQVTLHETGFLTTIQLMFLHFPVNSCCHVNHVVWSIGKFPSSQLIIYAICQPLIEHAVKTFLIPLYHWQQSCEARWNIHP